MTTQDKRAGMKVNAPTFEGFVVQMVKPNRKRQAQEIVGRVLGDGWHVKAFGDARTDFEVTKQKAKRGRATLSAAKAWKQTYRLRAEPGVIYVEPMFTVPVSTPPDFQVEGEEQSSSAQSKTGEAAATRDVRERLSLSGSQPLPESNDPAWSIKEAKVTEAWRRFFTNAEPGEKVIIGHPDTGYSEHPEIASRLLVKKGYDFVSDDTDAKDDLDGGVLLFPGHGTGTSSVIISPPQAQSDFGSIDGAPIAVWGVAPGARLIPIRVSRSVVLNVPWAGGDALNLARAIEHATDNGAHVISISMGTGFPHNRLLKAVQYAQRRGVIVLAAAGNYVRYVVWPAAYDEVIAVAASNAQHKTWRHSSRGSAVDVTAPGESVWCAGVKGKNDYVVGRGSGTSYAVATVAGIAALWLSHHGRDRLVERFGAEKIPVVFNQILRDSCDAMPGWEAGFGRGLVNAVKVLAAALPGTRSPVPLAARLLRDHPPIDNGGVATFAHLFENAARFQESGISNRGAIVRGAPVPRALAELLMTTEAELPARLNEVGQELAFHFAADPELYEQFATALNARATRRTGDEILARTAAREADGIEASGIASVRLSLLAKPASGALKAKLSTPISPVTRDV